MAFSFTGHKFLHYIFHTAGELGFAHRARPHALDRFLRSGVGSFHRLLVLGHAIGQSLLLLGVKLLAHAVLGDLVGARQRQRVGRSHLLKRPAVFTEVCARRLDYAGGEVLGHLPGLVPVCQGLRVLVGLEALLQLRGDVSQPLVLHDDVSQFVHADAGSGLHLAHRTIRIVSGLARPSPGSSYDVARLAHGPALDHAGRELLHQRLMADAYLGNGTGGAWRRVGRGRPSRRRNRRLPRLSGERGCNGDWAWNGTRDVPNWWRTYAGSLPGLSKWCCLTHGWPNFQLRNSRWACDCAGILDSWLLSCGG